MRNRASIRQWIGGVLEPCARPFLVFWEGGTGALCRVYTPVVCWWRTAGFVYAGPADDGVERLRAVTVRSGFIRSVLLFGAGHDGGYTTYSSIAGGFGTDDFSAVHHQLHVHDVGCGSAVGGWFGRRRGWHA